MSKKKPILIDDQSTELKIKSAARKIFYQKGYSATRTRDIAEESGINLALLNYYFRSKEKLFEIVMMETMTTFMHGLISVINSKDTSLEEKITLICESYINMIQQEPNLPMFVLNEIKNNAEAFAEKMPIVSVLFQSEFIKQYQEAVESGKITEPNPLHFLINLLGMVVFPFIFNPVLKIIGKIDQITFDKMMEERKTLIPIWIKTAMMKT